MQASWYTLVWVKAVFFSHTTFHSHYKLSVLLYSICQHIQLNVTSSSSLSVSGGCRKTFREMQEITNWSWSRCGKLREAGYPKNNLCHLIAKWLLACTEHHRLMIHKSVSVSKDRFFFSINSSVWVKAKDQRISIVRESRRIFPLEKKYKSVNF